MLSQKGPLDGSTRQHPLIVYDLVEVEASAAGGQGTPKIDLLACLLQEGHIDSLREPE